MTSKPVSPGPGSGGHAQVVTPRPGMQAIRPLRWAKAAAEPGDRELTVFFWNTPCMALAHVDVGEARDRVTVTLYEGVEPGSKPQPCIQAAVYRSVVVSLAQPLHGRRVVDGAPAQADGSAPAVPGGTTPPASP